MISERKRRFKLQATTWWGKYVLHIIAHVTQLPPQQSSSHVQYIPITWRVKLSQIEIFLDNICWQKFMILKKQFQLLLPTILHCCLSLRSLFRRDRKRFLHKFGGFPFKFKYLIREQPLWRENWFFLLWISQKGSHTEVKIRKLRPFLSELDSLLISF